jgi:hypothetical protein
LFFFNSLLYISFPQSREECLEMTTYTYDARGFKTASYYYDYVFGNTYTEFYYNDTLIVNSKTYNEENLLIGEGFFEYSPEGRNIKQENRKYFSQSTDSFMKKKSKVYEPDSSSEVIEYEYDNNGNIIHTQIIYYPGGNIAGETHYEYKGTRLTKEICNPNDSVKRYEIIFVYDIYGRKIKKITKYKNRNDNSETLYIYNTNGILVKEEYYRLLKPESYKVFKYNNSGRITGVEIYSPSPDGINEYISHKDYYELDKYGKLIKECHGDFSPVIR